MGTAITPGISGNRIGPASARIQCQPVPASDRRQGQPTGPRPLFLDGGPASSAPGGALDGGPRIAAPTGQPVAAGVSAAGTGPSVIVRPRARVLGRGGGDGPSDGSRHLESRHPVCRPGGRQWIWPQAGGEGPFGDCGRPGGACRTGGLVRRSPCWARALPAAVIPDTRFCLSGRNRPRLSCAA